MNEYAFSDLNIGHMESFEVSVTKEMENNFRTITGDINPLHQDDNFAYQMGNGKFSSHICFGMLTASFYSTLAGVFLPGKYSLIHSIDIKFQKPVYVGDALTVTGRVAERLDELKLLQIKAEIKNQHLQCVSKATIKIICLK